MRVFVLSNSKHPLMPCRPARARALLCQGKAAVFRKFPFTIILKQRQEGNTQPVSVNLDPGSKTTGIALVAEYKNGNTCIWGANLAHRGHQIKEDLDSRRANRRSRRHRKTRYRAPRFLNRTRPKGWLSPSLMSRVHNVDTWAKRLMTLSPVIEAQVETVRFDMQLMENPDIQSIEYQQGTLVDWEIREYLLYRHRHTCAYCSGVSGDRILEKEHVIPKAHRGTNRLANLVISCRTCNVAKGKHLPQAWLALCQQDKTALGKARIQGLTKVIAGIRPTLKDAAAVNATRYAVGRAAQQQLPTTFWSGGRTKKNRSEQGYKKDHWIDAACVGESGVKVIIDVPAPLLIAAKGHGSRQMCRMDKYGFPRTSAKANRTVNGFKTGDLVMAKVTQGKKTGSYSGRVAVRSSGNFNITTIAGTVQGINQKYCKKVQSADGYSYSIQPKIATENGGCGKQAA